MKVTVNEYGGVTASVVAVVAGIKTVPVEEFEEQNVVDVLAVEFVEHSDLGVASAIGPIRALRIPFQCSLGDVFAVVRDCHRRNIATLASACRRRGAG
jgi:hypothetical protein